MSTTEHREPYEPRGSRTDLGARGGEIPLCDFADEMPAHHNLEQYLDTYVEAADIADCGKAPLFRSAVGRTGTLTDKPMNRVDAWRMIQRRAWGLA